jgi:glycerate 2-kinase
MDSIQNAIEIFTHAVAAVKPSALIQKHLSRQADHLMICGNRIPLHAGVFIIGAGKAAALMAQTVEEIVGDAITDGLVVTKYEHGLPLRKIKLIEAGHPVPDVNSLLATKEMMKLVHDLTPQDVVIFLLSGGASSLLADCPEGAHLIEVQEVFDLLLKSGAEIHEMNKVRKHISHIKGGQLAKAIYPARLYALILSDVIGDDLDIIGSGPTAPDSSTFADAVAVLNKYQITDKLPAAVYQYLLEGFEGKIAETPKEGDACFVNTHNNIIGSNRIALLAAAEKARALGYDTHIITNTLKGEASVVGQTLAEEAMSWSGQRPACLLYGGESTVTIKGKGKGGRNMELALSAGSRCHSQPNITILAAGTDGTDGPTDAAGAVVNTDIMERAMALHGSPTSYIDNNDSYSYFMETDALLKTGPTQTNVMDIVITLIQ